MIVVFFSSPTAAAVPPSPLGSALGNINYRLVKQLSSYGDAFSFNITVPAVRRTGAAIIPKIPARRNPV